MWTDITQFVHIIVPVVALILVVLVAAFVWAVKQLRDFIGKEFVEKIECKQCMQNVKESCRQNFDEQYKVLENKIDQMNENFTIEVKELHRGIEQWSQASVRIETKVDMLLKGFHE